MGLIPEQSNLTVIDPALEAKRRQTYPGMAHFAGSGPTGKTCRGCLEWTGCGEQTGYYSKNGRHGGGLKPRPCAKYKSLMDSIGPGVPHTAPACKYFNENQSPPSLTYKS